MKNSRKHFYLRGLSLLAVLLSLIAILVCARIFYTQYTSVDNWRLANGRVLGGDFVSFYFAGKIFREDRSRLYDFEHQYDVQQQALKPRWLAEGALPFIYPPLVAAAFSVFANLDYQQAFFIWFATSLMLFLLSVLLVTSDFKCSAKTRACYVVIALAFFPFALECLGGGQTSAIGLLIVAASYCLIRSERATAAGIILGFSYYKPPLFLVLVLLLLFQRRWAELRGFAISAVALVSLTVLLFGIDGFTTYIEQASNYRYGQDLFAGVSLSLDKGVGLYAFFNALFPTHHTLALTLFLLTSLVLGAIVLRSISDARAQSTGYQALRFAISVGLSLLLSIQMVVYDLTLFVVPMLLALRYLPGSVSPAVFVMHIIAVIGIYLDFAIRNVAFFGVELKLTPLFLILWVLTLSYARPLPNTASVESD